jgi:hypothetical protein
MVATLLVGGATLEVAMAPAGCGGSSDAVAGLEAGAQEASVDAPDTHEAEPGPPTVDAATEATDGPVDGTAEGDVFCPEVSTPPTFAPAPGTYDCPQSVTMATSTPGATIFFTTDHTNPTTNSTAYSAPVAVSFTTEFRAIAAVPGCPPSAVVSAAYSINAAPPNLPIAMPPSGAQNNDFLASLAALVAPATICYTLDGSTPGMVNATTCSGPPTRTYDPATEIPIDGTVTGNPAPGMVVLNAVDWGGTGCGLTGMAPVTYTLKVATPAVTPSSGKITVGTTVSFTSATTGAVTFHYTTDGTPAACTSTSTGANFVTTGTEASVHVVGCKAGYVGSDAASASYTF